MRLRIVTQLERLRASLFFVPMLAVISAVVAGLFSVWVDGLLDTNAAELPFGLTSTVDSARALLSTVAGATISFAGIAFSVALLIFQLASSQYSPRVIHTLFREPFNRRIMALVVGTFTYCVVILRSVRTSFEQGGEPVIPNLSVAVAVVLGIATILGVIAFIDHSAHSMDVSEILVRVHREAIRQVRGQLERSQPDGPTEDAVAEECAESTQDARGAAGAGGADGAAGAGEALPGLVVRFDHSGWVQYIDFEALLAWMPEGHTAVVEVYPGRYAVAGAPFCRVVPALDDEDGAALAGRMLAAVALGDTRTMQQDVMYGLRQLVDVSLKALSPSVHDPTTAQDSIFHTAAVLAELLRHEPPPARLERNGRAVVLPHRPDHGEMVDLAYSEVRRVAAAQPVVCVYLLETLEILTEALSAAGLEDRTTRLRVEAERILSACRAAEMPAHDLQVVVDAYEKRFASPAVDAGATVG